MLLLELVWNVYFLDLKSCVVWAVAWPLSSLCLAFPALYVRDGWFVEDLWASIFVISVISVSIIYMPLVTLSHDLTWCSFYVRDQRRIHLIFVVNWIRDVVDTAITWRYMLIVWWWDWSTRGCLETIIIQCCMSWFLTLLESDFGTRWTWIYQILRATWRVNWFWRVIALTLNRLALSYMKACNLNLSHIKNYLNNFTLRSITLTK